MSRKNIIISALIGSLLGAGLFFILRTDYTSDELQIALESGENVIGKTVEFTAVDVEPNEVMTQTITSDNGLVFFNGAYDQVESGDEIKLEIEDYTNLFGIWLIKYSK